MGGRGTAAGSRPVKFTIATIAAAWGRVLERRLRPFQYAGLYII